MARIAGKQNQARSLAGPGGFTAEADAAARLERTAAGSGSNRGVETDRRRFYRGPLRSGQLAGRRSFRARLAAVAALSIRANLEGRNFAQIEAALRREDHPRNPFPRRLVMVEAGPMSSEMPHNAPSLIPQEWREEFEAAARRPLPLRMRYAFIHTYKPVLDDAPFRAWNSTADYRRWCEENLPGWLGYGSV